MSSPDKSVTLVSLLASRLFGFVGVKVANTLFRVESLHSFSVGP